MKQSGELITRYLREWPTLPCLTLAKKIYRENPERFTNIEHVRTTVRTYRGKHGNKHREGIKHTEFYNQQYGIPETYAPDYTPYRIDRDNILILSDLHIPFHDPEAIEQAVRWGKEHNVNCILLNGDIVDCYQLSRFIKDSRYPSVKQEIEAAAALLDYLAAEFPGVEIIWKNGNHDERIENFMKVKAPELLDVLHYQWCDLLDFNSRKVIYVSDRRKVLAGKLTILHGHEFNNRSTGQVNPARTLFLKTYQSSVVGHHHITSEHTDKRLDGDVITCWSVGCLCGLWPEYARINKWNHGFARVKVAADGTFRVVNVRIIDGKIY